MRVKTLLLNMFTSNHSLIIIVSARSGNGASNFVAELFGEQGRHARTTVGVSHLPLNALAEVEAVFEIEA